MADNQGDLEILSAMSGAARPSSRLAEQFAMMITPGRTAYHGLLGRPRARALGALTLYLSSDGEPIEIQRDSRSVQRVQLALVEPNARVTLHTSGRLISVLLIEPECLPHDSQLAWLRNECRDGSDLHARLTSAFKCWPSAARKVECSDAALDAHFFHRPLPQRVLDSRIAASVEFIRQRPTEKHLAADLAARHGLSCSRFVHLFRDEMGVTFRSYCAWKRARAMLAYVAGGSTLTEVAMHTGYPDSTHFSHSIRRIYGLRPRDIFAGSRRLAVLTQR